MNRKDIRHVLQVLGSSKFTDSGESVMTNCPLSPWTHESGTDRKPSLGVKEAQGMSYTHCFACGWSGGLLSLVREYGKYAIPDGKCTEDDIKQLIDFILLSEEEEFVLDTQDIEMPKLSEDILSYIGKPHTYFSDRGISETSTTSWRLGFHKEHNRAIFPVYDDPNKDPVGVIGRLISGDNESKYRNYPPKFKKSWFLYGLWRKPSEVEKLIVCEGPIDVIKVNQVLLQNGLLDYWAVGLMGAEPSKKQMELLIENAEEVIMMLDNDSSGKKGQKDLANGLYKRLKLSMVRWENEIHDPDEAGDNIIAMIEERELYLEDRLKSILKGNKQTIK